MTSRMRNRNASPCMDVFENELVLENAAVDFQGRTCDV
jgi:hypothetical protein